MRQGMFMAEIIGFLRQVFDDRNGHPGFVRIDTLPGTQKPSSDPIVDDSLLRRKRERCIKVSYPPDEVDSAQGMQEAEERLFIGGLR